MKFIPGPWVIEKHDLTFTRYSIVSDKMPTWRDIWPKHPETPNKIFIATTQSSDKEGDFQRLNEINEANARLIAAAPELYQLSKELLTALTGPLVNAMTTLRRLQAVLDKIESDE